MIKLLSLSFFIFLSNSIQAQIIPSEASVLHYRLIGFNFPKDPDTKKYTLEIAQGNIYSEDSFKKNIIVSEAGKSNEMIAEVPSFGRYYTWRIISNDKDNNRALTTSELHHFSTGNNVLIDSAKYRFRVIQPAEKYTDGYFFLDGSRALFDMQGKPVWYLPNIEGNITEFTHVTDLKMTPQGTITCIVGDKWIYEISYNGAVLWRGPSNGSIQHDVRYHSEFTRLANGHYLAFYTEPQLLRHDLEQQPDSGELIVPDNQVSDTLHTLYTTHPFTNLLEYDGSGNIVWKWSSAAYLQQSDVYYRTPPPRKNRYEVQPNSCYFDEKDKVMYISLRDINRILKVSYPDGKLLRTYGYRYKLGLGVLPDRLFADQGSIRMAEDGDLYLYSNGSNKDSPTTSEILKLREPDNDKDTLERKWQYQCTIENAEDLKHKVFGYTVGGSVAELPDHSFFVSMSNEYSKVFIVNKRKEEIFSGVMEKWDDAREFWRIQAQFHASFIESKARMEQLVLGHPVDE